MRDPASLPRNLMTSTDEIAPVWVLDDAAEHGAAQAIGVAERLGVPHLRVPLSWSWRAWLTLLSPGGSLRGLMSSGWPFSAPRGPAVAISAGPRSEAVALWLRQHFGTRIVHCGAPVWRARQFDLLIVPEHISRSKASNVLPVLGIPHRISPLVISQARLAWSGRLSHLPRPLITVIAGGDSGGGELRPSAANSLARRVARLASSAGGSALVTTSGQTGNDASDALAAGLAPCMHLLHRWGEPGDNPYLGMLALADAVIVTGDSDSLISEACASPAPVYIASLGDSRRSLKLHDALYRAKQARPLGRTIESWSRTPLDEAGRAAAEIRARMAIGPYAAD